VDALSRPTGEAPFTVAVVGATATGKSDLAVELALALGGEVVNADAMQLYRGMDVGTAKLTADERRGVPHHLLDVLDVRDEASVAAYQRDAREALRAIAGRGHLPVLAGGSGLYVRAVLERLEIPPTDAAVRARLEADLAEVGPEAMHARLAAVDPRAAAHILPGNVRRTVRALEVVELTGRPFSATQPEPGSAPAVPAVQLGLRLPRPELGARIDARVDRMFDGGLVAETRALEARGLREGRTASRALGYAQVLRLLAGAGDEATARADTAAATRRFARRQETWFRRDPSVVWLPADAPDLLGQALAAVAGARPPTPSGRGS
jgi:tRNA dimethylallyltransferase